MVTIEEASKLFSTLGLEKHQIENLIRQYSEYFEQNKMQIRRRFISKSAQSAGKYIHI